MNRHAVYDQHARDPEAKRFYNSAAWKRCRANVLADHPTCQRCEKVFAEHVHHVIKLRKCTPSQKLDPANLLALCVPCHNAVEGGTEPPAINVRGMLKVVEDAEFAFDYESGERPIRFIEKYCRHYEGRFAGEPFILLDWQKHIIRTLFGWKSRATGFRRFKELYILTAKGSGKTPMLAAIGLYMLLMDGEPGAHVVSMASSFEQANLTFDFGKKMIAANKALQAHAISKQYQIRTTKGNGKWTLISGKPTGRSGPRPSCVIADEVHEWPMATGGTYNLITANLFKRSQPLTLVATNAGDNKTGICWVMHERAMSVLRGDSEETTLLPVIFEADTEAKWDSEAAATQANPSLGSIVSFDQLKPEVAAARANPAKEARYRRLYLSQWVTGVNKWLDMAKWETCCKVIAPPTDAPRYVGLDLSACDDLCACISIWPTPDHYHVDAKFWLPRKTAEHYQEKMGLPFRAWEDSGAIELLDEPTISNAVRVRIGQYIVGMKPHAVCYDRYKSADVVAELIAAGIDCRAIPQGYTLSPGCEELDRRLKEGSISITSNKVLRWNAENAEVTTDTKGNFWPVKPGSKNRYAGLRSAKIDGIVAMVTGLVEARKHSFPVKAWAGGAWVV